MSDPTGGHPQTAEGQAPDARLTERLLARATRPLGVIDVHRAESHYARIMDWLARRTPLLEHLMTRYGLTEGEGAAALSLAFADVHAAEGLHAGGGVNLSAGPDAFAPPAAERLVTYVAHVPDDSAEQAEAKRITRRGVPTFSRAGSETQHPDADARREPNEAARQQERGPVTTIPEGVGSSLERVIPDLESGPKTGGGGSNVEVLRGSHAAPSVKEIPASTAEAQGARVAGAPLATAPRAAATAPPQSTQSPTQRPAPPAEGRATAPTAEPERTFETARGRRDAPSGDLPSLKEIPAAGTLAGREKPLTSAGVAMPARPGASGASGAPGTDASAPGTPAHVAAGVRETRAPDAPAERPMPLARAREIPADDSRREPPTLSAQSPTLSVQAPLPLAAHPVGAERGEGTGRRDDSAAAATQVPPVAAETFTPGGKGLGARAGGVNVERLTEQVSRRLERRLVAERERRKMSGR